MQHLRRLPHHTDRLYLTDGGIETWLMCEEGNQLPHFCGFQLLDDARGREALRKYYREFALIAKQQRTGYVFCSLTYRASRSLHCKLNETPSGVVSTLEAGESGHENQHARDR